MFGKIKGFFTSIKDKLSDSSNNIKQIVSSVLKQSVKISNPKIGMNLSLVSETTLVILETVAFPFGFQQVQ